MVSRTLSVKIVGDTKSGEAAVLQFASSLEKAQKTADVSASKIYDDLRKMEAAANDAAAANEKLAAVGSSGGAGGGTLGDLLRMSGSGNLSNAGFSKIADSLDTTAGKAALAGVGIAAAGAVAVKFGSDAVTAFGNAAETVRQFQEVSGGTAQQASVFVNATKILGVSTDSLDASVGRMLKNAQNTPQVFDKLGISIAHGANGAIDGVATFQNVANAINSTSDAGERNAIGMATLGRGWQTLLPIIERAGPALAQVFKDAAKGPIFNQEDIQKGQEINEKIGALKLRFGEMEVKAGEVIAPIAEKWIGFATTMVGVWEHVFQGIIDGLQGVAAAGEHLPFVGGKFKEMHDALAGVDLTSTGAADGINKLGNATDDAEPGVAAIGDSMANASKAAIGLAANTTAAASAFQAATADIRSAQSVPDQYAASLDQLDQLNQKMTTSSTAVADAQVSGAKQIADAQKGVEQALQGVADAQASYAKAVDDANRSIAQAEQDYSKAVDDANRKVVDADEQASKRIVDAQQKVIDARHRAAEEAVSSARRVEDATQALRDAETDALRDTNPYDAQRKREDAGKALTRAQEDAAQQQSDSADTVAQAEQDLADTQQQAAKDRATAERDAADQIAQAQQRIVDAHRQAAEQIQSAGKQVADAEGRVADASARVQQTNDDAQAAIEKAGVQAATSAPSHQQLAGALQGVTDNAFNAAYQMKQAGASDQDIQAFLDTSKQKIDDYGGSWGFTAGEIKAYNDQIDLIKPTINVRMTLDASDFYNKIGTAAQQLHVSGDELLADANFLGVHPQLRDQGGWLPTGVSVIANKTGRPERILSPSEMEAGGGGGTTIIVQGSVISDRDLADIIAKAQRRGYKGFS